MSRLISRVWTGDKESGEEKQERGVEGGWDFFGRFIDTWQNHSAVPRLQKVTRILIDNDSKFMF